jgi:hypothetical protein
MISDAGRSARAFFLIHNPPVAAPSKAIAGEPAIAYCRDKASKCFTRPRKVSCHPCALWHLKGEKRQNACTHHAGRNQRGHWHLGTPKCENPVVDQILAAVGLPIGRLARPLIRSSSPTRHRLTLPRPRTPKRIRAITIRGGEGGPHYSTGLQRDAAILPWCAERFVKIGRLSVGPRLCEELCRSSTANGGRRIPVCSPWSAQ